MNKQMHTYNIYVYINIFIYLFGWTFVHWKFAKNDDLQLMSATADSLSNYTAESD